MVRRDAASGAAQKGCKRMTAATHVLYAGRCVPIDHLPQLLHPSNAVLCRDERGQVAPAPTVPLAAIRCRVVGHDGATTERHPGIAPGHMKGDA
jgi:hypothetical protein